jgi:hypothetical protein
LHRDFVGGPTILLNYLVSDQEGAKTAQSQTIIVSGTNDAPTLTTNAATGLIGSVDKGGHAGNRSAHGHWPICKVLRSSVLAVFITSTLFW